MTTVIHTCPRCPSTWAGLRTSHCAACHETFTGLAAFDKHRAGLHTKKRYCRDLVSAVDKDGQAIFVLTDRTYRCWTLATPSREEDD